MAFSLGNNRVVLDNSTNRLKANQLTHQTLTISSCEIIQLEKQKIVNLIVDPFDLFGCKPCQVELLLDMQQICHYNRQFTYCMGDCDDKRKCKTACVIRESNPGLYRGRVLFYH